MVSARHGILAEGGNTGSAVSAPNRRARKLDPAKRREQLLSCALQAFAQFGLNNAGHTQVAQLAGVSVPTIFTYFPTRDALVRAVLAEVEAGMMDIVHRHEGRTGLTTFDRILDILIGYAEAFTDAPDLIRIFLSWSTSYRGDEGSLFQAYNIRVREYFSALLREGIGKGEFPAGMDVKYSVLIILGSTSIIAQMRYWNSSPNEVEEYLRALLHAALGTSVQQLGQ